MKKVFCLALLLVGCTQPIIQTVTPTPTRTEAPTETPSPTASPTNTPRPTLTPGETFVADVLRMDFDPARTFTPPVLTDQTPRWIVCVWTYFQWEISPGSIQVTRADKFGYLQCVNQG